MLRRAHGRAAICLANVWCFGRPTSTADAYHGRPYDERTTNKAWESFLKVGEARHDHGLVRGVIENHGNAAPNRASMRMVTEVISLSRLTTSTNCVSRTKDLLGSSAETFRRVAEVLGDAATMVGHKPTETALCSRWTVIGEPSIPDMISAWGRRCLGRDGNRHQRDWHRP